MNLLCPKCAKLGVKSEVTLTDRPVERTTIGHWPTIRDGVVHDHDPNRHTRLWRCEGGHTFEETFRKMCQCGWPSKRGPRPTGGVTIQTSGRVRVGVLKGLKVQGDA